MIPASQLNPVLIAALPELAADQEEYARRKQDPEFSLSFFSYSFIPTLQSALDRQVEDFCARAFAVIERLVGEGDREVQALLQEELFAYGPMCEKWMKRAESRMGPLTRKAATQAR